MKNSDSILWREKDVTKEVERFRQNYAAWVFLHPERIKHTGGKNSKAYTADHYIERFLANIEEIDRLAKEAGYPWEWCIDYETYDGEFFCPNWIIRGNSMIYGLGRNHVYPLSPTRNLKVGYEGRYVVDNSFYPGTKSSPIERWVCNYFRVKPENFAALENKLQAGHIKKFDINKSCIENNNMYNVEWQTATENVSEQVRMENGNGRDMLQNNGHKEDSEDFICTGIDALGDERVDATVQLFRTGPVREDTNTRLINGFRVTQHHVQESDKVEREKFKNFDEMKDW